MQRVTLTSTCYHMRYRTFFFGLAWFGAICNGTPTNLQKTRGNPLQTAQNQVNLRENTWQHVW